MKNDLTFEQIKNELPMENVLEYMGFARCNKQSEIHAMYKLRAEDGGWAPGPKFMFRPPSAGYPGLVRDVRGDERSLNVIQVIKRYPEYFPEYQPGMKLERLVNVVCRKLMKHPEKFEGRAYNSAPEEREPFNAQHYKLYYHNPTRPETASRFQPWFRARKIGETAQKAFAGCYFLASSSRSDGKIRANLAFPMHIPGQPLMAGMEERGYPNQQTGKSLYKGVAKGSDCTNSMWIAQLSNGQSWESSKMPASQSQRVFWFESALDAMAFYEHKMSTEPEKAELWGNALYVSTAGQPSPKQVRNLLAYMAPEAQHILCFDHDAAGDKFSMAFAMELYSEPYKLSVFNGQLKLFVGESEREITVDLTKEFDFENFAAEVGVPPSRCQRLVPPSSLKDWNEILMAPATAIEESAVAAQIESRENTPSPLHR